MGLPAFAWGGVSIACGAAGILSFAALGAITGGITSLPGGAVAFITCWALATGVPVAMAVEALRRCARRSSS
jgi:hypothetical protein